MTKQNNPTNYTRRSPRESENWNNEENNEEASEHYRSPRGERELKSDNVNNTAYGIWSLPTRGVWIEIDVSQIFNAIENDRSPCGK